MRVRRREIGEIVPIFFHILQESIIFALLIRETGHPTGFFTILDFIIRQFMQDFNALEGKSLAELREIGRALGVGNVMLKKKELLEQIRAVALVAGQHSDTEPNAVPAEEPKRRGRRPRMSGVKGEGRSPVAAGESRCCAAPRVAGKRPAATASARRSLFMDRKDCFAAAKFERYSRISLRENT